MFETFLDRTWPLFAATGAILIVITWVHFARDKLISAARDPEANLEATRKDGG